MWNRLIHKWLRVPYLLNVLKLKSPSRPVATVVLLHGISSSIDMWPDVAHKLPDDIRVVAIDLLGFGKSPKPNWATYDARAQSRSIKATLTRYGIVSPVILVGHSLGSLVSIDVARRYSRTVKSLVLVSPPLYDSAYAASQLEVQPRDIVRAIYHAIDKHQTNADKLLRTLSKYYIINKGVTADNINVPVLLECLRTAIISQSSYVDIKMIKQPIRILSGKLDPFVAEKTIKSLSQSHSNIHWRSVIASHEITGRMQSATIQLILSAIDDN